MSASEIANRVLAIVASNASGVEASVRVDVARARNTRFAVNEITTAGDVDGASVSLTVAKGQRHVTVTTNRTDDAALTELVKRAAGLVDLAPEDPEWVGVVSGEGQAPPADAAKAPAPAEPSDFGGGAARKVISVAEQKGVVGAGFYMAVDRRVAVATTRKLAASYGETRATLTITARTNDGSGSGWAGVEESAESDVAADKAASVAIDKALLSLKPGPLRAGAYKVVLEPAAVADLLGFLVDAMDRRAADEGRSFFSKKGGGNRIGERLFRKGITLKSDPSSPVTPAQPFNDDGFLLKPRTYIEDGTLKELVVSRFWAKKQNIEPTGSPTALHLEGGKEESIDALVKQIDRGLLVTRFWYTRWLDPQSMTITGLTRDGVFLVETGRIKGPVNNFRFNESPARVLANALMWTKDTFRVPVWGQTVRVPAIVTDDFHMSSVSAAV
jgi:predicted Zn-dependent protease